MSHQQYGYRQQPLGFGAGLGNYRQWADQQQSQNAFQQPQLQYQQATYQPHVGQRISYDQQSHYHGYSGASTSVNHIQQNPTFNIDGAGVQSKSHMQAQLQMRVLRAQQQNLMCKQAIAREIIMSHTNRDGGRFNPEPSHRHAHGAGAYGAGDDLQLRGGNKDEHKYLHRYNRDGGQGSGGGHSGAGRADYRSLLEGSADRATRGNYKSSFEPDPIRSPDQQNSYEPAAYGRSRGQTGEARGARGMRRESSSAGRTADLPTHNRNQSGFDPALNDDMFPLSPSVQQDREAQGGQCASSATVAEKERALRLQRLAAEMAQTVADGSQELLQQSSGASAAKDGKEGKLSEAERLRRQELKAQRLKHVQDKQEIESLLKRPGKNLQIKMPLWKHRMLGNLNPPESSILRGKSLFRAIARSVLYIVVHPALVVMRRRLARREVERRELDRTLRIVADEFDDWLGRLVHQPIASIAQDANLNFEPADSFYSNSQPLHIRMLQLKVRVKAVVRNIASAPMPSEHITNFLACLCDDDNIFSHHIMFPCEIRQLEFSSLGATRGMLLTLFDPSEEAAAAAAKQQSRAQSAGATTDWLLGTGSIKLHSTPSSKDAKDIKSQLAISSSDPADTLLVGSEDGHTLKKVDATRVRILIQNFLLVRVLIGHLLLSPWRYNIGSVPSSATRAGRRVLLNYRVLASVVYLLLQRLDPTLPPVSDPNMTSANGSGSAAVANGVGGGGGRGGQKVEKEVEYKLELLRSAHHHHHRFHLFNLLEVRHPPSSDAAATTTPTTVRPSAEGTAGVSSLATPLRVEEEPQQKGQRRQIAGMFGPLSKMFGLSTGGSTPGEIPLDSSSVGGEGGGVSQQQQGVDALQLSLREQYESLPQLHRLLLPASRLAPIRKQVDEWAAEWVPELQAWLRSLVQHVVNHKINAMTSAAAASGSFKMDASVKLHI